MSSPSAITFRLTAAVLIGCCGTLRADSRYPEWWISNQVIRADAATTNDYAAANQGQVKWITGRAYNEFDFRLTGGAGPTLTALVSGFTPTNNFLPVNHGQLKAVASLFYDRLSVQHPWTGAPATNDHAQANIGQVKWLFSFGGDSDDDSLPDYWENYYLSTLTNGATGDADGDGLSNLGEYWSGTDPTNEDTDGDGIGDGQELAYGESPKASNTYSTLPFIELFETNTVQLGFLHGQNNWTASPTNAAIVQTNVVYEGSQALSYDDNGSEVTSVRHLFACTNDIIWMEIYLKAEAAQMPTGTVEGAAAMLFDSDGHLVVYDGSQSNGQEWVALTNAPTRTSEDWVRLTAMADYTQQKWLVCMDGLPVATNLGFASYVEDLTALDLRGGKTYSDNIRLKLEIPDDIDLDQDGMNDAWEIEHFGSAANGDPNGDDDSDGLSNLNEFGYLTDPNNADSDGDGLLDGAEVRYGKSPSESNTYAQLPFVEMFEVDTVQEGPIHGQNDWEASPTNSVLVQTNEVYEGDQALGFDHTGDEVASVRHLFVCTNDVVWMDVYIKAEAASMPTGEVESAVMMLFDNQGYLQVYDGLQSEGEEWLSLTNGPAHDEDYWVRLTAKADYSEQKWLVCMDGSLLATNLGFASPCDRFTAVDLRGRSGSSDNLTMSLTQPEGLDLDGDGMEDTWEVEHF